MIVDANILLYARNTADPRHEAARAWLEGALNGTTRVRLPWWTLSAFVRIATNARAFPEPLTPEEAMLQVDERLDAPRAGSLSRQLSTATCSRRWFGPMTFAAR